MREPCEPFEQENYVRMMFRQMPGAVWTTDTDLRLTYVAGRSAENMSPIARAGMSLYEIFANDGHRYLFLARHRDALLGQSQSFETDLNGRWFQVFIDQLKHTDGIVVGCIGAAFDIT